MILKTKKLGEVVSIVTGKLDANAAIGDGEFPFYTCSKENSQINETAFDGESILLSGNGEFWVKYHESGKFNAYQRVYVIKTEKSDLFLRYVYYFMVVEIPKLTSQGAVIKYLRLPQLQNLEIPLPPLSEQKRIVKILDEKIGKIKEAIKLREEAIFDTEKILSRNLSKIFAEGKKNGWDEKELNNVGKFVVGGTPSRGDSSFWGGDIPWVSSGELNNLYISKTNEKITKEGLDKSNAKLLPVNSLLVGMYDTAAFKLSISKIPLATNQAIISLLPDKSFITEYVYFYLTWIRPVVMNMRQGVRQKNLNSSMIKSLKIVIPSINEQKQIVQKLDVLSEKIKQLKELQISQLSDLKRLEKSLLREAFNGEL